MKTKIKKMRKLTTLRRAAIVCSALLLTFSCDDDFLADGNPSAPSISNSFATVDEARASVFAIYAGLQENESVAREWWWLVDTLGDELKSAGPQLESQRAQLLNYDIDAANGSSHRLGKDCIELCIVRTWSSIPCLKK